MIDIHSHILPGIDDGAVTLEDSVDIVRELASQGVTDIIATPHYIEETIYMSLRTRNLRLIDELKQELADKEIAVNIYLGNEIYINEQISELLEKGEISPLADSDYILVELPMSGDYPNYMDILANLMQKGFKVILAHPERYAAIQKNPKIAEELHEMGVFLQCNTGSITGQYGKHAYKVAKMLAKRKMIFAFGSDIHHCRGEDSISQAKKKLGKYYKGDELTKVLVENPREILQE